jgi:hypothetical protein
MSGNATYQDLTENIDATYILERGSMMYFPKRNVDESLLFRSSSISVKPSRRRLLLALLVSDAFVALVNLFLAYRAHSFGDAAIAVVLWLVIAPVISVWWVRNMESNEGKGVG